MTNVCRTSTKSEKRGLGRRLKLHTPPYVVDISKTSGLVAVGGKQFFRIYRTCSEGFTDETSLSGCANSIDKFSDIKWHPQNEGLIVVASSTGEVFTTDITRKREKNYLFSPEQEQQPVDSNSSQMITASTASPHTIDFNHYDPDIILCAAPNGYATIFNIKMEAEIVRFKPRIQSLLQAKWNPKSSNHFALSYIDGCIEFYDIRNLQHSTHSLNVKCEKLVQIDWNESNSNYLATLSDDGMIKIWDLTNCQNIPVSEITSTGGEIRKILWRPQFPFHISSCGHFMNFSVSVWDIRRTSTPYVRFAGHSDIPSSFAWSNDGFILVSIGSDRMAIMHDFENACYSSFENNLLTFDLFHNSSVIEFVSKELLTSAILPCSKSDNVHRTVKSCKKEEGYGKLHHHPDPSSIVKFYKSPSSYPNTIRNLVRGTIFIDYDRFEDALDSLLEVYSLHCGKTHIAQLDTWKLIKSMNLPSYRVLNQSDSTFQTKSSPYLTPDSLLSEKLSKSATLFDHSNLRIETSSEYWDSIHIPENVIYRHCDRQCGIDKLADEVKKSLSQSSQAQMSADTMLELPMCDPIHLYEVIKNTALKFYEMGDIHMLFSLIRLFSSFSESWFPPQSMYRLFLSYLDFVDSLELNLLRRNISAVFPHFVTQRMFHECSPASCRLIKDQSFADSNNVLRTIGPGLSEMKKNKMLKTDGLLMCAVCLVPCSGLVSFCRVCGHGGHLQHCNRWFASNTTCPTCRHKCVN